jgi:threonine-phosphate decarboxylase
MHAIPCPFADPTPLFRHGDAAAAGRPRARDFSVTVNPLGPPRSVLQSLRKALPAVARYPDPESRELTERLAAQHRAPPAQVVVGNGASELIAVIPQALRPRRVVIVEPTYTEYLRASLLAGAAVEHVLADRHGCFGTEPFDPGGADLVWLCNPNNPTGRMWLRGDLLASWVATHPRSVFVIDESFLPFHPDENCRSLIPWLGRAANAIVVRSLTKVYALPGLRLGYAVTTTDWAARLRAHLPPWSVNALAQRAGLAALDDAAFLTRTVSWFRHTLPEYLRDLSEISSALECIPTQAPFALLRVHEGRAPDLLRRLAGLRLSVRDASNFVGLDNRYLRVAMRTPSANARLLDALCTILKGTAP